ncbi:predicted protein [Histoplasma capsulatum G186AR]|uniref:Uncharacterized protein n=1 Tax=Ajellomyces capsulatus (strain G186AR / H82 / ATCC MYA-2454 / RMSCC 2432) TaxID=447093 RepID=C0NVS8_AJECG|nr:uncharacterized protein HCBG_07258 [Histoplasma capsulatum G186AR]EEH04617.1 predicted protein [Histoplasma capsulatum G186AR]
MASTLPTSNPPPRGRVQQLQFYDIDTTLPSILEKFMDPTTGQQFQQPVSCEEITEEKVPTKTLCTAQKDRVVKGARIEKGMLHDKAKSKAKTPSEARSTYSKGSVLQAYHESFQELRNKPMEVHLLRLKEPEPPKEALPPSSPKYEGFLTSPQQRRREAKEVHWLQSESPMGQPISSMQAYDPLSHVTSFQPHEPAKAEAFGFLWVGFCS